MKKGKFISGTVLSVISAVCFGVGTYFLYLGFNASDFADAIVAIIAIPLAIISYAAQYLTGGIAEVILWNNVCKNGWAKIASMVVAIVCAVLMLSSIVLFAIRATA